MEQIEGTKHSANKYASVTHVASRCACCGGTGIITREHFDGIETFYVICLDCGLRSANMDTPFSAEASWELLQKEKRLHIKRHR